MIDPALIGVEVEVTRLPRPHRSIELEDPIDSFAFRGRIRGEHTFVWQGRAGGGGQRACLLIEDGETHELKSIVISDHKIVVVPLPTPLEEMREFELSEDRRTFIEEALKHDSKRYGQWTKGMRDRAALLSRRDI
jgi:hypothetical protein